MGMGLLLCGGGLKPSVERKHPRCVTYSFSRAHFSALIRSLALGGLQRPGEHEEGAVRDPMSSRRKAVGP